MGCSFITVYVCVLLASVTKQSRTETSLEIKKISEQYEYYSIIKEPDDQSSIDMSENVTYSTVEHQPQLITSTIYETIN